MLLQKPLYHGHVEIYNDLNSDLVNFWMTCRDHGQALEDRCRSLPYSRELYYSYHASLYDGCQMPQLERAVRWFYVMRSSFSGWQRTTSPTGWSASALKQESSAYHSAIDLFSALQSRMRYVLIDHRDFEPVLRSHDHDRTLFYVDPPYVGAEKYYHSGFSLEDHTHLAELLNASNALVALSYSPHALVDRLYPPDRWRRVLWSMPKHSQRSKPQHEVATEMLLMNYEVGHGQRTLWTVEDIIQNECQDLS